MKILPQNWRYPKYGVSFNESREKVASRGNENGCQERVQKILEEFKERQEFSTQPGANITLTPRLEKGPSVFDPNFTQFLREFHSIFQKISHNI